MQGKSTASFKDSSLFGVSLSDHARSDFGCSALRCKVVYQSQNSVPFWLFVLVVVNSLELDRQISMFLFELCLINKLDIWMTVLSQSNSRFT